MKEAGSSVDSEPSCSHTFPSRRDRPIVNDRNSKLGQTSDPANKHPPNAHVNPATNLNNAQSVKRGEKAPASRGTCKFDGTDYPDWLPINPFKKAEEPFTLPFPEVEGDPWAKAAQLVKGSDDEMCDAWVDEIQNILIFAGLFSAVVTAFAVETQKMLLPDPSIATILLLAHLSTQLGSDSSPVSSILAPFQSENIPAQSLRINILIYFSLVLSLGTALVGIVALQWIRSYRQSESQSHQHRISLRHVRYQSLIEWKVPEIIATLPLILQASLVIFFAGLIDFLHSLNAAVTIIISLLIGALILSVLFTMVAPSICFVKSAFFKVSHSGKSNPSLCPYQSPQSWLIVQLVLYCKKGYHLLCSALSGSHSEQHLYQATAFAMTDAKSWPKLTQLHHDSLHGNIGFSLGCLINEYTDLDSFLSLFHCFQTLDNYEMQHALTRIHGEEDSELMPKWTSQPGLGEKTLAAAETKHLLSLLLIDWAKSQYYWTHRGIDLYVLELSLRSTTYSLPPVSPDTRMVPSRLPVWADLMIRTSRHRYDPLRSELWIFGVLVSLQQSNLDHSEHKPSTFEVKYLVDSMEYYLQRDAFETIDDTFGVFSDWLEDWQTGHPDEDVEFAWQQRIVDTFISSIHHRFLDASPKLELLQRPAFLSLLDCLANHPKGQRAWKCLQSDHPYMQADWDRFFVDGYLESRYSALVCDQALVEGLVENRGKVPFTRQMEYTMDSDIYNRQPGGFLAINATRTVASRFPHPILPSDPAGYKDLVNATSTAVPPSVMATINAAIPLITSSYSAEGVDVELGIPCSESTVRTPPQV